MTKQTISTWMVHAQETILRIFTEDSPNSSTRNNHYCLRAHCGTYTRLRS